MQSKHLILWCPLLLLPLVFPSMRVFSNESAHHIRWPKYWSFSISISSSSEYSGMISLRIGCLDLLAVQGILKSLLQHHSWKASILRSAFFMVQLPYPYMSTGKKEETWKGLILPGKALACPLPHVNLSNCLSQVLRTGWKKSEAAQSCPALCKPMDCSLPWGFPSKNIGAGCHLLLQGAFLTQGSNLGLLHCRQTLYHLSHQRSPSTGCLNLILFEETSLPLPNSSVQSSSIIQSCQTLCDPTDCSMPGFPVHHQLPELIQTHVHWVSDAIQPSLPLSPPSPPTFNLSQYQDVFQWVSSLHQVAKVLEFQLQQQSFQWIFRTDFL